MLYADLNYDSTQDNMSGTPIVAWAIPFDQVYRLPFYKANPIALNQIQVVDQDVIPKAYRTFYKIYATSDTGRVDDTKLEGTETGSHESIYEFYFPKNDSNALGFMRMSAAKWVFIVQESDGNLRILGIHPGKPATIKSIVASTGTISSGNKGATFQVRSLQNGPAPKYTGKFNLDRDSFDLSLYPMLYTEMRVTSYNGIGFPLVIEYWYNSEKFYTWYQTWNDQNQLTQRSIEIHVN